MQGRALLLSRRQLGLLGAAAGLTAAAAPQRGGTLVMTVSTDPPTVNMDVTTGVPDTCVAGLVQEGLVRLDNGLRPVPNLAESWTIAPDGLRYTFKLVRARWHDGQDFTAADVKFTLEQVSAKFGAKFRAAAAHIDRIETPDDRTVDIWLKQPFGPFLFCMSGYANAAILPAHVFAGTDVLANQATLATPIGTGPFKLTERVSGDHITLVRNPEYWRPGLPYLDSIVFKIIPNPASNILALKSGEIDFSHYYFLPISQFRDIVHDPSLQIHDGGIPGDHLMIFNLRRPPFDQAAVRQALFTALDRNFILKAVFQGYGATPRSAINTNLAWAHNPDVDLGTMYPFDPAKAAAMLDAAGLPARADGTRFDIRVVFDSGDANYGSLVQVLTRMWQRVGVRVVAQGSTRNAEMTQVYDDWDFDLTIQSYTTAGDPALGVSRAYVSSAIEKAPFVNCSGYSNPEVDRLFEAGANAATPEARAIPYKQVQVILARDLPALPFWQSAQMNVASTRVKGPWAAGSGYEYWEEVWLDG